jgi:hypothetical protein
MHFQEAWVYVLIKMKQHNSSVALSFENDLPASFLPYLFYACPTSTKFI